MGNQQLRQYVKEAGLTMTALAEKLGGPTRSAIAQWKQVPPQYVLAIERLTGWSRYAQRPDIFGPDPDARKVRASKSVTAPKKSTRGKAR